MAVDHPDLLSLSLTDYCDLVHRDGGFIIHAHPFRQADYINMIRLLPHKVDAVEVINVFNTDFENKQAEEYANNYDLYKIAGSDNHHGRIKNIVAYSLINVLRICILWFGKLSTVNTQCLQSKSNKNYKIIIAGSI